MTRRAPCISLGADRPNAVSVDAVFARRPHSEGHRHVDLTPPPGLETPLLQGVDGRPVHGRGAGRPNNPDSCDRPCFQIKRKPVETVAFTMQRSILVRISRYDAMNQIIDPRRLLVSVVDCKMR